MDLDIKNKVAIITGSSKGIGYAIAEQLAIEGVRCVITARDSTNLAAAAAKLRQLGANVLTVVSDITKQEEREKIIRATIDTFGTIDILVNNAGGIDQVLTFEEISHESWVKMFEWNVFSVVEMMRLVIPHMKQQKWGRIINIGSESGIQPDALFPHYNAAKAAVLNLTKSMSKEYGKHGILINSISPAFVYTDQVKEKIYEQSIAKSQSEDSVIKDFLTNFRPGIVLKRMATPKEVAGAVAFLSSEKASFITGTNIRIDGGSVGTI